nr:TRAP transporter small permease [Nitrosomonas nitrosa]
MSRIEILYARLIAGLAAFGCLLCAAVFVAVVVDVTLRSLGFKPPEYTSAFCEYALLYMTALAAPWLVREKANVSVVAFVERLPLGWRSRLEKLILVVCALICFGLCWYSAKVGLDFWRRGEIDIRSIEIPRWVLFAVLSPSFAICAIEFSLQLRTRARTQAQA